MGDAISITVIATGFGKAEERRAAEPAAKGRPAGLPGAIGAGAGSGGGLPRIIPMKPPAERAPQPVTVRMELEDDELDDLGTLGEEPAEPVGAGASSRSQFRMAPGSLRRPFGGRVISKDNMDVPAFMRKQMD
jgi:hypothetical protein